MPALPPTRYFYRTSDGSADPKLETDWTEDADGVVALTADGTSYDWIAFGPSNVVTIANDATPTIGGTLSVNVPGGETRSRTPTYGGTNLVYSISGPAWFSIRQSDGRVTVEPPLGTPEADYTATVTASNDSGSFTATFTATVAAAPAFTPVEAAGGTESTISDGVKNYRVHVFTTVGPNPFTVTVGGEVEYLVVAGGGGGGGNGSAGAGGGGGAGGFLKFVAGEAGNSGSAPLDLTPGTYSIVVGDGGAGVLGFSSEGENGGDSRIIPAAQTALLTALGGGGGGSIGDPGLLGGSGGGGGASNTSGVAGGAGTAGQGFAGGDGTQVDGVAAAGGGGGASETGQVPVSLVSAGDGGDGVQTFIRNLSGEYYAGGGAGGSRGTIIPRGGLGGGGDGGLGASGTPNTGTSGTPNTGGGGGGGTQQGQSGDGGSGIVILRYQIP